MNILVVASTLPASESDSVPSFVRDQVVAMKKVDPTINFTVLAPHDSASNTTSHTSNDRYEEYRFHYAWPRNIEKLAGHGIVPALQANPLNYLLIPALFLGEFIALLRKTKSIHPDVIYAHWFTPQAVIASIVGTLTNTPYVFTTHASDVSVWHKIPVLGTWMVRVSTRKAAAITAVSRRSLEKLERFFGENEWNTLKKRTKIIPMGVELNSNTPETNGDTQKLLFIGRLVEKKGVQHLLPAFKNALSIHPDMSLTIAGDGPWKSRLMQQSVSLGLEKSVTFPGYTTGETKKELINSHGIFIVPSIITSLGDSEGMPVSLMEGMAAGRVCIASNESGADDIITNGQDGFLVPGGDESSLTKSILEAATLDGSEANHLGTSARKTAEQFSWPEVAERHIEFLFRRLP